VVLAFARLRERVRGRVQDDLVGAAAGGAARCRTVFVGRGDRLAQRAADAVVVDLGRDVDNGRVGGGGNKKCREDGADG
jgi:hypothetical protein